MEEEARELTVDIVTCELVLETAKACRDLRKAIETIDVETVSSDRMEIARKRMMRITLFARLVPSILDPRLAVKYSAAFPGVSWQELLEPPRTCASKQ